ncbi:MAG: hypothetical protein AAF628_21110 [Planctomycetota bacterium]
MREIATAVLASGVDPERPVLFVQSQVPGHTDLEMLKSRNNEMGLFDATPVVLEKLRGAKTDPQRLRRADPGNPDVRIVFSFHGFFLDDATRAEIDRDWRAAPIGCVDCKKRLAASMAEELGPIQERAQHLRDAPGEVDEILAAGAAKARREAEASMTVVRDATGT